MCLPNMRITTGAAGERETDSSAREMADPDRSSEEADAVGRPDSQKGVQELEDYYKRRKRLRRLAIERGQRGGERGFGLTTQGGGYGSGGGGGGGKYGMGGGG